MADQPAENFTNLESVTNIDALIRKLSRTRANNVLFSYPEHEFDFMNFTGSDLERITASTALKYTEILLCLPKPILSCDLEAVDRDGYGYGFGGTKTKIIALIGISNLEYYFTFLSLQRLGYTTMFISPRLAEQGYAQLLRKTGCHVVVASGPSLEIANHLSQTFKSGDEILDVIPMLDSASILSAYKSNTSTDDILPVLDATKVPGLIIHTGGTTGLPKPVPIQRKTWIGPWNTRAARVRGQVPEKALCTLPLFHSFGLGKTLSALRTGSQICLLNAARPVTASAIWKALDVTGAKALASVPYVLKFFVELDGGVQRLAQLDQVVSGGAATPDELGELLIRNGVNMVFVYGQTESGILMLPIGKGLGEWYWMTPIPETEKYLRFEHVVNDMYHLIVLPGLDSKILTDRPDGSYGTKDLWRPHPANEPKTDTRAGKGKWKFVARHDDIIVLVNGENADPTLLENSVRNNPNVQMAVAFGSGHESLGMLIIPSEKARGMSEKVILNSILPDLERGNELVSDYAKISPEDIIIKPIGTEFPMTDKSTLQRAPTLLKFSDDIKAHYAARDQPIANGSMEEMSDVQVHETVRRAIEKELLARSGTAAVKNELKDHTDLFALGIDSLQASRVRTRLLREIPMGGKSFATNLVFENPSIEKLTKMILDLRLGKDTCNKVKQDVGVVAEQRVKQYTEFASAVKEQETMTDGRIDVGEVIVLTGATGYIGVQILNNLIRRPDVSRVYCLTRTSIPRDHNAATSRIEEALANSKLLSSLSPAVYAKTIAFSSDLGAPDLGLHPLEYEEIRKSVTALIHNAWAVNFNMTLESFEPNIASTSNLMSLCLKSRAKAGEKPIFVFISSLAAVMGIKPKNGKIEERRYDWQDGAPTGGYGQSKWVAEQICCAAAEHLPVRVLRVGQVSGDTKQGIWNSAEAIPAMAQTALTIGTLPTMEGKNDAHYWLPSDVTGSVIAELTLQRLSSMPNPGFFFVASPYHVSWNDDVLRALRDCGLQFDVVSQKEWVKKLEESDKDVSRNPPYKLVEHFKKRYAGIDTNEEESFSVTAGISKLDMTQTFKYTSSLVSAPAVDGELIKKYVKYWIGVWGVRKEQFGGGDRKDSGVGL